MKLGGINVLTEDPAEGTLNGGSHFDVGNLIALSGRLNFVWRRPNKTNEDDMLFRPTSALHEFQCGEDCCGRKLIGKLQFRKLVDDASCGSWSVKVNIVMNAACMG
ncbi:MAG: hypothetical protein ACTS80_00990 [Candidatus Hodgkinia cicadicola]